MLGPWNENDDNPRHCIKKHRNHFADKGLYSQSYGFSSSHVRMWELDHKEDWVPKKWCFWIVVLEKTLESLLDSKIKSVSPKGNQAWVFIGRTDAEASILWPPNAKSQLVGKDCCWERLRAGGEGGSREWESITDSMDMNLSKLQEIVMDREPGVLQSMGSQRVRHDLAIKQQTSL